MDYTSQPIPGIRRPPVAVSIAQCAASLALLAALAATFAWLVPIFVEGFSDSDLWFGVSHMDEYWQMLSSLQGDALLRSLNYGLLLISAVLAAAFLAGFAFWVARIGLGALGTGLREWLRPHFPGRVPSDLSSVGPIQRLFREQIIGLYEAPTGRMLSLFGRSAAFLSPAARPVAVRLVADIGAQAGALIGWLILLGLVLAAPVLLPVLVAAADPSLTGSSLTDSLISASGLGLLAVPVAGMIALRLLSACVCYLGTSLLLPSRQPSTESLYQATAYDGFGHPQQLVSRLPDLAKPLEWQGFRNRFQTTGVEEQASRIVKDGGTFSASVFIEQQPRPVSGGPVRAAVMLFAAGWVLRIATVVLLAVLLVPEPVLKLLRNLDGSQLFLSAPIFLVFTAILIGATLRQAQAWVNEAGRLFGVVRFASEAVLVDLEGTITKSNLTVGRARDDSVESSNVVVRSDLTARFRAGSLLSEVERIDGPRTVLGVSPSDASQQWVETLSTGIESLRKGVAPIGVDLGSAELRQLMGVNASAVALKEVGRQAPAAVLERGGALFPSLGQSGPKPAALDEPPGPDGLLTDDSVADFKECPSCAESVRARARKCRFCGHAFDAVEV